MQFAVDTGGTFTDLVVRERSGIARMFKAPTTPDDPIRGVLDVLGIAAEAAGEPLAAFLARGERLVHGTTHALNAVVTGNTARTALLVTVGHPDILVLREGGREEAFNFTNAYPAPYIPRGLTFEIPERIRPDGSVMTSLDEAAVVETLHKIEDLGVAAIAVCLLWSIANGAHELRVGELIEEHLPGIPYTLSHQLNPSIREFRRASSVAIDASLKPQMARYMNDLEARLRQAGFPGRVLVVTSQAGVIDAADAAAAPIHIVNSGPSMAPIAGRYFARIDEGAENAIVADTGGTTYDVSLVRRGEIPTSREAWIGPPFRGVMIGFPWVDVKSVGAGGGSIAWVDRGGLLHVGPQSAGAVPGPVAYGRGGTRPTVTDASLVLGHLDADNFLGGAMKLDVDAARFAIETHVATPLGITVEQAADAILAVVTENMVQAIVDITVNQGADPREAVLIGGGGAAGLNSVRIARRLSCRTLLVPEVGATLSAAGASMSDLKGTFRTARFATTADFDFKAISGAITQLREEANAFIANAGTDAISSEIRFSADARYATQVWEIEVPLTAGALASEEDVARFVRDFHRTHKSLFAFDDPNSAVEIIGITAEAICRFSQIETLKLETAQQAGGAGFRKAYFGATGWIDVPVHPFDSLAVDHEIEGPAIVESPFTTVVVDPGATATRRASGSLSINTEGRA
ncbi:MAG: 5-oxoprolinase [Ancylobacter novellus]|uniref:5-oxoprolinase n=1 Tax=Ancylobacter novellus TaxID=921 RepID=A0A2W5QY21_ANCNO|nr:MAG: 5-oxoprolinase [Ancylobacter novellus]